jgi:hypothetical protein
VRHFSSAPFGILRGFFLAWSKGVFTGVFEKNGCSTWCFCGQDVVNWVAKMVLKTTHSEVSKFCSSGKFIFGWVISTFNNESVNFVTNRHPNLIGLQNPASIGLEYPGLLHGSRQSRVLKCQVPPII